MYRKLKQFAYQRKNARTKWETTKSMTYVPPTPSTSEYQRLPIWHLHQVWLWHYGNSMLRILVWPLQTAIFPNSLVCGHVNPALCKYTLLYTVTCRLLRSFCVRNISWGCDWLKMEPPINVVNGINECQHTHVRNLISSSNYTIQPDICTCIISVAL